MNITNDPADRYRSSYDIFNYETFGDSIDFSLIFEFDKLVKNTNIFENHKKKETKKFIESNKNIDSNIMNSYCYYGDDSHEFYNEENPKKRRKIEYDNNICDMV
jgi:hypothetical protein